MGLLTASGVFLLPRRGAVTLFREMSFSGGGPRDASRPITIRESPLSTAFTIPLKDCISFVVWISVSVRRSRAQAATLTLSR